MYRKSQIWVCALTVLAALLGTHLVPTKESLALPSHRPFSAPAVARARLADAYGKLPLSFETNNGQTDSRVKFISRGSGYALFLTANEATLALKKNRSDGRKTSGVAPAPGGQVPTETTDSISMTLVGANPAVRVAGVEELPGKINYFIGSDPAKWHTNVPTYAKVRYQEVYRGIDLVYYGSQRRLEYDFIVAPGADSKSIEIQLQGARQVTIDRQGALVLDTASGPVRFEQPVVYQDVHGKRREIEAHYALNGTRTVSFNIGSYDRESPLIIDPVLVYSTYLGGSSQDYARSIAVDSSGNAYITGVTTSTDFPTLNAIQSSLGNPATGNADAFITKINVGGTALVYSTYLGGHGADLGTGIAVDSSGNAYMAGETSSSDFPTVNAFQPQLGVNSLSNAFVTKINSGGNALIYSTYLGGTGASDWANAIAVDSSGNAYVTGRTNSLSFPTTVGAVQPSMSPSGAKNAFISKFNASGSSLGYSTFLGGSQSASVQQDEGTAIEVDSTGIAYVAGYTTSSDFPVVNALQSTLAGSRNAFLTKINPSGSALTYSTYLGGNGSDSAGGIAIDSAGNAYVAGSTSSTNFPTVNPIQSANAGGLFDAFITKVNSNGSAIIYSTYLGGSSSDNAAAIALDASGNVYITGTTYSYDFPTVDAFQSRCSSCVNTTGFPGGTTTDVFVAKINAGGSALIFSTFLGGNDIDMGFGIALDAAGDVYLTGYTYSTDFPTVNALKPSCGTCGTTSVGGGSNFNAFVAEILATVDLAPQVLTCGDQTIATAAPTQMVAFRNDSAAALTISAVAITGTDAADFSETNNCVGSVAAGATCTLNVGFTPGALGPRTATLSVTDTATNPPSSQTVALSGTGITPQPFVSLSPSSLTFLFTTAGGTTDPQTVTLRNTGTAALNIQAVAITGLNMTEFAIPASGTTCMSNTTVSPGGTCAIQVTFTPMDTGTRTASVMITDNAADSPETISLSGSIASTALVALSTTSISFPNQYVGTSGLPQSVTLTNNGNNSLFISSVIVSPSDFGILNACGSPVVAGTSCAIGVFFDPTVGGARSGTLTITDGAPGSPHLVALAGTGQDFSLAPVASSSASVSGGQTAHFSVAATPVGGFNQTVALTCGGAPALSTCTVSPSSIALNGTSAVMADVMITTTAASQLPGGPGGNSPSMRLGGPQIELLAGLLGLLTLSGIFVWRTGRSRRLGFVLSFALFACIAGIMSACGSASGGGGGGGTRTAGTPAGTYTVVVSGRFASGPVTLTHNSNLTLTVQ